MGRLSNHEVHNVPFLSEEEFNQLMTIETVSKQFGASLVNLLGGTETSRRELANATKDQDGVLYNIEELREIWEFIAQVFERFCFVFILYSIFAVSIWAFMVPSVAYY